ncbi:hypothetical protein HN448_04440, partial [archaeon]|nr:hypothetical protein [archaeon]
VTYLKNVCTRQAEYSELDTAKPTDIASGWDFTSGWSNTASATINNATQFTTTVGAQGIYEEFGLIEGNTYVVNVAGSATNGSSVGFYQGLGGASIGTGDSAGFSKSFEFVFTDTGASDFYIRYNTDGVVTITKLEIYEVGELQGYTPIKHRDKYLECTSDGTIGTQSTQAYGTWEWDMMKGDATGEFFAMFMASVIGDRAAATQNGYYIGSSSSENFILGENTNGTPSAKFATANDFLKILQWHHVKVTRTLDGEFTVWVDGTLAIATSGTNPVTDATVTTSQFVSLDIDVLDRIANFKFTPIKKQ